MSKKRMFGLTSLSEIAAFAVAVVWRKEGANPGASQGEVGRVDDEMRLMLRLVESEWIWLVIKRVRGAIDCQMVKTKRTELSE